ncbi:MAG TPA: hypothetical protein VEK34_04280 [Methylocella sp.]|nr:hypothetical protein [Methylocella sp.]
MQGDGLGGGSRLRELGGELIAFATQQRGLRAKNGWISLPLCNGVNQTIDLTVKKPFAKTARAYHSTPCRGLL